MKILQHFTLLILFSVSTITFSQRIRGVDDECPGAQPFTIPVENFCPNPIIVTLNSLPEPFSSESAFKFPTVVPIPENATLNVPRGFAVNVYAADLDSPRWLALTPENHTLVSLPYSNQILLLRDLDNDNVAEEITQFAGPENGLNMASGMAFADGFFYLANTDSIVRYPYELNQLNISGEGETIATFPGGGNHWSRNIIISPDGEKLYVSIGSASNADVEELPRASVQVMNLNGSDLQTFAFGLRNPNGLDFHPVTGELYTTVNERDELGDDLVPDYFTRIQQGEFFGWPYAYLSPNNLDPRLLDEQGQSLNPELANQTIVPDVLFQAHSASLGFKFYNGKTFPLQYSNGAFVAFRGSWNRNEGTGYKIVYVEFDRDNVPTGYYEDFVTGFEVDPSVPSTWGRPVSVLILPDGSLLFTEESNGRIYRVQYLGKRCFD